MYANVIFLVHYSLKDRNGTISFPFYETAVLTSKNGGTVIIASPTACCCPVQRARSTALHRCQV